MARYHLCPHIYSLARFQSLDYRRITVDPILRLPSAVLTPSLPSARLALTRSHSSETLLEQSLGVKMVHSIQPGHSYSVQELAYVEDDLTETVRGAQNARILPKPAALSDGRRAFCSTSNNNLHNRIKSHPRTRILHVADNAWSELT